QIENVLSGARRIGHRACGQLNRLFGKVNHALGVDLFDGPDVYRVIGSEELVSGAFTPTVKTPLMISHEVLARQDWMFLDPNHCLAEIKAVGLKHWWIITAVGITSPNVEATAGVKHARHVAEPSLQKALEFLVRDKVIGEWPIFSTQLLAGRLGL